MSETTAADTEAPPRDPTTTKSAAREVKLRTRFGRAVADRVRVLQKLSNEDRPRAVSTLAILRRAVGTAPATDPEIWSDTLGLVPDGAFDPRSDEPSSAEIAAHHAMTLFALHRQGRVTAAHVDGAGPGTAFANLAWTLGGAGGESEGVRRRFDAMITATTPEESAWHLRGIVQLLRASDIGLDYGLLAEDLADLWSVRGQNRTRLRWARQYRRVRAPEDAPAGTESATTPSSPSTTKE